ncbi:hypothetical protein ABID29_001846 [Streptococcus rupicaprae]|uniref:Uncharacterized protein n=1 Tax=Streptococcus rupicaprae TaxID=759619 RepID=A0ABV2FJH6_9STRE
MLIIKRIRLDKTTFTWQGAEQWVTVYVKYRGRFYRTKHLIISDDYLTPFGFWLEMHSRYFDILKHMRSVYK